MIGLVELGLKNNSDPLLEIIKIKRAGKKYLWTKKETSQFVSFYRIPCMLHIGSLQKFIQLL